MTIALTTIAAASLAILVYIAVIITGTSTTQNIPSSSNKTSLSSPFSYQKLMCKSSSYAMLLALSIAI